MPEVTIATVLDKHRIARQEFREHITALKDEETMLKKDRKDYNALALADHIGVILDPNSTVEQRKESLWDIIDPLCALEIKGIKQASRIVNKVQNPLQLLQL